MHIVIEYLVAFIKLSIFIGFIWGIIKLHLFLERKFEKKSSGG